jgi:hypothetical protein
VTLTDLKKKQKKTQVIQKFTIWYNIDKYGYNFYI